MSTRTPRTGIAAALALAWSVAHLAVAPAVAATPDESEIEQARARAAEEDPKPPAEAATAPPAGGAAGPLFAGVDDAAIPAQRIDVGDNSFSTAFVGDQVWGSAYDPFGDRVFFNSGSTLLVWPVGGSVSAIGTIVDAGGAAQAMVGLAFYNGVLYGTKNIANEAIWQIDTTTAVATVFIDYADGDFDCGGFAADPATGEFYCTNDDTSPGSGLYRMNPDGTGTLITAYPMGQSDIDGLAVGGGRAYLVTDDMNGPIFVWDFGLAAYQAPLVNNWPTSETFAAGAWIAPPVGAAEIALAKTVGLDPNLCATETEVAVPYGTTVHYCFRVTNTGTFPLNSHDLVDSHLGTILDDFAYVLAPSAETFVLVPAVVDGSVTNTATWTASVVGGPSAAAEATATVTALNTLVEVPTLSGVGLAGLALAVGGLALAKLRRRRAA